MASAMVIRVPELPSYGFLEIQVWIRRNTLKSAVYSIGFVLSLFLLYGTFFATRSAVDIKNTVIKPTEISFFPDPAPQPNIPVDPAVIQENIRRIATLAVTGNPIATPDVKLDNDDSFGTFDKMLQLSGTLGTMNTGNMSDGEIDSYLKNIEVTQKPVAEVIPPEWEYIKVEKDPIYDDAELMKNIEYPQIAVNSNIQGRVIVNVYINKEGKPVKANITQSDSQMLNDAAVKAILKTTFAPAIQNQVPVGCWLTIPINFVLQLR